MSLVTKRRLLRNVVLFGFFMWFFYQLEFLLVQFFRGPDYVFMHEKDDTFLEFDNEREFRQPFNNSKDVLCKPLKTRFLVEHSLPLTPMSAFAGSGITWVRHLIEGVSGVFTNTIYKEEPDDVKNTFPGWADNMSAGTTFCVKTHDGHLPKKFKESRALLLIRNPFEAMVAYMNWLRKGKTGESRPEWFRGHAWEKHVEQKIGWWKDMIQAWYTQTLETHVILYEKLSTDLDSELMAIMDFLYISVNLRRLECTLRNPTGNFLRPPLTEKREFPYSKEQVEDTERAICQIHGMLKADGLPGLPLDLYLSSMDSKYVGETLPRQLCGVTL